MENLTILVSILVAFVAWREWFTNKQRLKHELFDRRYSVYEQITSFMASIVIEGGVPPNKDIEFLQKTKQAYFVFGCASWVKYLVDDIYKKAVTLQALEGTLPGLQGEDRKKNLHEQTQIKLWFSQELKEIDEKFEQFFKLST
ncbi:hypothetical protein L1F06_007190 [Ectopseudomonas hydrolytica]|uniref:Uncharacterized protein n=1 Tax=Ectopseudomonas hydrolytica TaxID=2493633 RepID=A0ABY5ADE3_9GAMM|nr:hypothetical protein [Pseudomonas hydrolytica]USR41211.1 hypothetical protein L1F06_007190 [Pseudomonas hydrolytica]